MKIKEKMSMDEFKKLFDNDTWDNLVYLDGKSNSRIEQIDNVGKVEVYLGASSEGADRGGYVTYIKLLNYFDKNDKNITFEMYPQEEPFFIGRSSFINFF